MSNRLVETGIAEVDREHRELLELIEFLRHACLMADKGWAQLEIVRTTLSRLMAFSRHHFAEEERLMQLASYPDYQLHKSEHTLFLEKIQNLQQSEAAPSSDSLNAIENWLFHHVEGSDQLFVSHLDVVGVKRE
jgi:hemerythrin